MEKQGEQQQQQQQGVVQVQPQPVAPADPAAPQQCPRCYSRNTKFCYYNNYSASQPRHLCKTCRRYWTQGGTLRNVPIGGGSRKGKRAKTSSSSSSTSSDNSQSLQKLVAENHLTPTVAFYQGGGSGSGVAVGGASAGGYLASLSTLNQLNNPSMNYHFDPSLINFGGVGGAGGSGSSSNLGLFQSFNAAAFLGSSSSSASQHQNIPQQQFYQLGNGELLSLYNNSEQGLNLVNNVPSTMANNNYTTSAASMLQTQSFMNGAATATSNSNGIRALSDASLWSTVSTTNCISGANNTASAFGASTSGASSDGAGAHAGCSNSLAPNQWFDLQRFQPPPQ